MVMQKVIDMLTENERILFYFGHGSVLTVTKDKIYLSANDTYPSNFIDKLDNTNVNDLYIDIDVNAIGTELEDKSKNWTITYHSTIVC
jgi:hypothetical protein